jgi:FdhD protein
MASGQASDVGIDGPSPAKIVARRIWRGASWALSERHVAEEVPLALTYDGATYAVMMGSPADLEDFAYGFSLTEGIVAHPNEIEAFEVAPGADGIDLRLWLGAARGDALAGRRRRLAGPVGCGLCGIESLRQASRDIPVVTSDVTVTPPQIMQALAALFPAQNLNGLTSAAHAAGFWQPNRGMAYVREDVGRHNALDKLAGALARGGSAPGEGMLLITSRLSVELVQKAAMMGCGVLVAISAPTALALRVAEAAGVTLVGVARADGFEVFTHGWRVAEV